MGDAEGLPAKVVSFDALRIRRHSGRGCHCEAPRLELDTDARLVTCTKCGQIVDAFEALQGIAERRERIQAQTEALLEDRRQIIGWKPHLVALRKLEALLHERKMMPSCPHCCRGITLEEFGGMGMVNREIEMERRKAEKEARDGGR